MPLLILVVFLLVFVSCDMFLMKEAPLVEDNFTFYAVNTVTGLHYKVRANFRKAGQQCEVWVEENVNVSDAAINAMVNEFDNKRTCLAAIRPASCFPILPR